MNLDLNLLSPTTSQGSGQGSSDNPKKLAEAARQFEALMITQMMKSARDTSGWLSDGDETGEDSSMSMAEEQFAQSMASNGGLGLAKMIVKVMSHEETNDPAASSPAASSPSGKTRDS